MFRSRMTFNARFLTLAGLLTLAVFPGGHGRSPGAMGADADAGTGTGARVLRVPLRGGGTSGGEESWPGIGCWFWTSKDLAPDGYREFLDLAERHSNFGLLTTSLRAPVEVTDPAVHDQIRRATAYARGKGIGLVMDLDVRLARQAFLERHPDELQEIVRIREVPLGSTGEVTLRVPTVGGGDHYTFRAPPYQPMGSRLLRVFTYVRDADGIRGGSVEDRTARCTVVRADREAVEVRIPCIEADRGRVAAVLAAHTLFTPDVFAPHLIGFERRILEQYADVPLAGVCKDEWGFPGGMADATNLWFSRFFAEAYARRRPGHGLERDLLLMAFGEKGREGERAAAINHYMALNRERNAEVETAFRDGIRAVFGPKAIAATHPTWFPYPDAREVFKNGIDWWAVPRELAQTDEATPFAARTALAKRWGSPVWMNMYYDAGVKSYEVDLWRHVLGGGRMNFHPLFPGPWEAEPWALAASPVLRASARVGLLDLIATAAVDCPVAVVFGHASALNWSGAGFGRVGLEVTDALWAAGQYTDLIPTSEIASGALSVEADGRIRYGAQRYSAVVLYQPQYESGAVAAFFRRAGAAGGTAVFRVGDWTLDFEGRALDGAAALGPGVRSVTAAEAVRQALARLEADGVGPQTPGAAQSVAGFPSSTMPNPVGHCRLLDGTVVFAAGEKEAMGDPLRRVVRVQGEEVSFDAVGLAAVRVDAMGRIEALAAGGLKAFAGGGLELGLEERTDLALWRDATGAWQGVVLGHAGPLPAALERITPRWTRLRWPEPRRH